MATGGQILRVDEDTYLVASQSGGANHAVTRVGSSWRCDCHDHTATSRCCKHIHSVRFALDLPRMMDENALLGPSATPLDRKPPHPRIRRRRQGGLLVWESENPEGT